MGHVGRHARSFRPCAPLATIGEFCAGARCSGGMHSGARGGLATLLLGRRFSLSECFPRSSSSTSDALSSPQYPQGVQATTRELGSQQQALDISAVRLFKSPSVLLSSHGSNEQIGGSSYSSVWERTSSSTTASVGPGDSQKIEQLWEKHFAQWWDNIRHKRNPKSSDFRHEVTGKALRIDGRYAPAWVKAKFKLVARVRLQSDATYTTKYSQDTAQGKRQPEGNNGESNTAPQRARALGQVVQGGGGSLHLQSAKTLSEAIAVLKNRLRQGFIIDSYMYVEVLKRCLKEKDLMAAKQVHDCILKSRMEQNIYVVNNLLRVYIGCGRLQVARRLFDALVKKDGFSWNIMIKGYAQHNHAEDALGLFNQMCYEGVQPDECTYLIILKACASSSALDWGKEVHANIRQGGLESDVRVGTALLKMYAKCECIIEARQIFDNLTNRDVISWNVMIGAYADSGRGEEAYELFLQMQREGCKPNAITYLSILNASVSTRALDWVKEVHRHVLKAGLEWDVRVANALVHMYAKGGSIDDARLVFDRMKVRDVVTWTAMIGGLAEHGSGQEAYELFLQMLREGCEPDVIAYVNILNACASIGALDWGKEVHRHILEGGVEWDVRVGNALVHMYAKSGSIADARMVFDGMKVRDVVTWTAMIGGLAEHGFGQEAYGLFLQMRKEGCEPDAITYVNLLNVSASAGALDWVKEVHRHVLEGGVEWDVRVANALVHMYAKGGSIDDARVVFDRMKNRDVASWTAMIGGLAEHGCVQEAYELFLQMLREGCKPNACTYVNILNACASIGALDLGKEIHRHVLEGGDELAVRVGNALVHMYAKSGSIANAKLVFNRMKERDVILWNVMVGGLTEHGCGQEAYELFLRMQREGYKPDAITYVNLLNASASAGALYWVKEVHRHVLEGGVEWDVRVANALVHMYSKSGSIADARVVFDRMKERDVTTWNVMIGGLGQHGFGQEALGFFREMNAQGVKPDGHTFVAVLSACSHSGLVDEGRFLYSAMTQDYGIEPDVFHCTCMVDLLGRAGRLEEAKVFIGNMVVDPNEVTWGALLSACRTYGNVELGEFAAKELLKLNPKGAATYVLLSNVYAGAGRWDMVSSVRTMMRERGIHKERGRSWIEVDNKIHGFVVADLSHTERKEIYENKDRVIEKIKAEGYIPDTRLVLKNIDEEDKELDLCSHSEKLAIVYGLMHTPAGNPIRVFKNFRVCRDCHTASKFVTKVEGREIILRDAIRFHHFKDGVCSCGDYW